MKKSLLFHLFLLCFFCIVESGYSQTSSSEVISGQVTDTKGDPLPGISVKIKGSSAGTSTDSSGRFTLRSASRNPEVVFTSITHETKEVRLGNQGNYVVQLQDRQQMLRDVVVVGYGTQRKTDLTGAISSINTKEFDEQPVNRVDQVLQGRAAGVQVTQAGGAPGGESRVRIRGANSVLGNNDPLYVVDGFVGADFNMVNPNDIESIQVLKDAASTSIYGSRGANGVVIITTKKGSRRFRMTYEGQLSASEVIKKFDVLPAGEFAEIVNARAMGTGTTPPFSQAQIDNFKATGGTNWQDLIYRTGVGHQHQLTLSGGGDKTTFMVSGNFLDQKGIVKNSDFKRYIIRTNLSSQVSERISFRLNTTGMRLRNFNTGLYGNGNTPIVQSVSWAPTTPAYGPDGLPTFVDVTGSVARNPLDLLYDRRIVQDRSSFNAIGGVNYKLPIEGLSLDVQYAINYMNAQNSTLQGQRVSNNNPSASRFSSEQITLQNTNALNYIRTFNKDHNISAVAVFETQQFTDNNFTANASNIRFPNQVGYYNIGPNGASSVASDYQKWNLVSLLGRFNYSYKDKYLLTAAFRRDGSSKFRGDNQFSSFPSIALGWKLSEENFIKNLNIFSNLKLRGSWGKTGSQAIGPYATISRYNTTPVFAFNNSGIVAGIFQGNPGNPNLRWETTIQKDFGVEMGFFNNRLRIEADVFTKNTEDLLLNVSLPSYAGGGSQTRNVGAIQNKGFELAIGATIVDKRTFNWSTNFNVSTVRNKVISLGGLERLGVGGNVGGGMSTTNEFMLIPGQPLGSYWGLRYVGTYKPDQKDLAALQGRFPGDPHYEDINGDNAITTDDFQIIGRAFPKATGGWNNTFTHKALTLNVFFQGVFGVDKLNYTRAAALSGSGDARQPTLTEIRDYYRPGNEDSDVPAFSRTYQPYTQSSRFIENGSYIRLKNISLSYNFPLSRTDNSYVLKVFGSATNLLTITDYKGIDPEASNVGASTDAAMGIDYGAYPNSKMYTFGVNLSF